MNHIDDDGIDVIEGLGIPSRRIEVLRALRHGPATVSAIMEVTGLSRGGVLAHLRPLFRSALVTRELRPTAATRPVAYYSLDHDALTLGIDELVDGV